MQSNNNLKKNLNTIRNEIRAAFENSGEFDIENYENFTKEKIITIINHFHRNLKNIHYVDRKENYFKQIFEYYNDFKKFGATFAERESSIKSYHLKKYSYKN
jgi:hypothetical protein